MRQGVIPPYGISDLSDPIVVDDACDSNYSCEEGYVGFLFHLGTVELAADDGSLYCGSVTQRICLGEGVDALALHYRLVDGLNNPGRTADCQFSLGGTTFRAAAELCAAETGISIFSPPAKAAVKEYITAATGGNWKPYASPEFHLRECFRLQKPTLSLHFDEFRGRHYLQWTVPGLSPGDRVDIEIQHYDHDADSEGGVWRDDSFFPGDYEGIDVIYAFDRDLYSPGDKLRVRAIPSGKPRTSLLASEYSEPVELFPDAPTEGFAVAGEGDGNGASQS